MNSSDSLPQRDPRGESELVTMMAHELRSPLAGVKGFVGAVLTQWDRLADEQKLELLTCAHADAERLERLITGLLDTARIDTGRFTVLPRAMMLAPVVHQVLRSTRAWSSRPVTAEVPDSLEVWADPDKLDQVLTNLIENSVRHGAGTIAVTARCDGDDALIEVSDQGSGFAPDDALRACDKHWSGDDAGGSGLGLYLVAGIARAHHASVEVVSGPPGRVRLVWPRTESGFRRRASAS